MTFGVNSTLAFRPRAWDFPVVHPPCRDERPVKEQREDAPHVLRRVGLVCSV